MMATAAIEAECLYRSFLSHCFYDVEKLEMEATADAGNVASILESFSTRSLLEKCEVVRAQPRRTQKALQVVVLDCPESTPGVAVLVHDANKKEVYCMLHLYSCDVDGGGVSSVADAARRWRTMIRLPGCNTSVKIIFVEGLLLFCQPDTPSGCVLVLDTGPLTCMDDVLTAQPVLTGISFSSCTGCYDASIQCVLLSCLGAHSLLSVTVPVDPRKRRDGATILDQLSLAVPRGSLHFHVCCEVLVVCPSRITQHGWVALASLGKRLLLRFEMQAKVCLQYCLALGGGQYLLLLALEDGTVQPFRVSSSPPSIMKTGPPTRVFDGDFSQWVAVRCAPAGDNRVALISKRQCALLSVTDAVTVGVVTVLSRYDAPAVSNMDVLRLQFPATLQGNFPYVLLVSSVGQSCVRVFPFQRTINLTVDAEKFFCGSDAVVCKDALEAAAQHSSVNVSQKLGLLAHIKHMLQGKRRHSSSGYFEPRVKEEHVIATLCQGFGTMLGEKECPPYEVFALDSRFRGFLMCTFAFGSHDCYILRDAALHNALRQVAALFVSA
ncbi:hypothetical protein TraAM80_06080 [Trypanosoma rangeli]|uniref:Uncharacterized protein n=1 Tax=Trypanosoma rangeli TaxID=5698 RepID=A0A3R7K7B5_TRYRA|nr:uncharacterized protein TraAM80_06080 [Trypanosoma rangeli]RNF02932.1 hypothetical protein TraAM80_06080 [Trypanosoma rangeli]|eukprot:RNF02932.1 hypothetical protein TraAM80_06080 [Trypanosoma rangeli]